MHRMFLLIPWVEWWHLSTIGSDDGDAPCLMRVSGKEGIQKGHDKSGLLPVLYGPSATIFLLAIRYIVNGQRRKRCLHGGRLPKKKASQLQIRYAHTVTASSMLAPLERLDRQTENVTVGQQLSAFQSEMSMCHKQAQVRGRQVVLLLTQHPFIVCKQWTAVLNESAFCQMCFLLIDNSACLHMLAEHSQGGPALSAMQVPCPSFPFPSSFLVSFKTCMCRMLPGQHHPKVRFIHAYHTCLC
jgi:hypothetical protein